MVTLSSPLPDPPRIAIVGAGLAGLATSLFLCRQNLSATVFESRPRNAADGGFIALAPNAVHVLDQLGLYQTLLPHGFAYEEYTFLSSRNCSRIATVLNGSVERYGYPALRISRHVLRQTLLNAVTEAGIEVRFEHKLTNVSESAKGVSVSFSATTTTTTTTSMFDYLVGCDGIHSRVRRSIFPSLPDPVFSGQMGIGGGQVPRSLLPKDLPQPCLILGPDNSFMMMPTCADGSIIGISATIETDERTREQWADLGADTTQLQQMLIDRHCASPTSPSPSPSSSPWPAIVQDCCHASQPDALSVWPFFHAPTLDSWTSPAGRTILIGDAAHAMPPTGGQGAAMAFEDAASLSLVLATLADASSAQAQAQVQADLLAWQARRRERVTKVKAFTSRGGDIRRAPGGVLQQIVKEWLMWAFFLLRGREGGFAWIYNHRETGPRTRVSISAG